MKKPKFEKSNETLHIRVKPSEKDHWKALAEENEKTLAKWVIGKLNNPKG